MTKNNMDELKAVVLQSTREYVDKLLDIWSRMFDEDTCEGHLQRLDTHARSCYEELYQESLEKKENIEDNIKVLQKEAANLQRLLKTQINLPTTEDDVPLMTVQMAIDKSLVHMRETLRERNEVICELLLQEESLCEELGERPRQLLLDPMPSAEEIENFRSHLDTMRDNRMARLEQVMTLRSEIKKQMKTLQLVPNTDTDERLLNQRHPLLTIETIEALRCLHNRLTKQVSELSSRINVMREKIEKLWRLQDISDSEHMSKIRSVRTYDQSTYDLLYMELQRCEALRRQNLKKYVEQLRSEIDEWWQKTLASDVERKRFSHYNNNFYTEDLLKLHELELEDIKLYYNKNKEIFDLFTNRNILWDRMTALEAKANEPGRFNNRGGQLLKEERERKTIASKLPKIEQQIAELVKLYEEREHATFKVHGENILNLMAADWQRKEDAKKQLSSARKQLGHTQQGKMAPPRTPLSMKNMSAMSNSTASLRKTPSNQQLAYSSASTSQINKRKLHSKESQIPSAKRSLLEVFASPLPSSRKTPHNRINAPNKTNSTFKSPLKKMRVIATTIGRKSVGGHKRRSVNKNGTRANPTIRVQVATSGEDTSDYESFQKSIEPASRSSVLPATNSSGVSAAIVASSKRTRAKLYIANEANSVERSGALRLAQLPKPYITAAMSQQQLNANCYQTASNISRSVHQTPSTVSGRKLATKNLPIII